MPDVLAAIGWFGSGVAALFAVVLLSRRGVAERWLGAGFAAAALAGAVVTASHAGRGSQALEGFEVAVTLAAGPLAAGWLAVLIGHAVPRVARLAAFAPAVVWLLATFAGRPWAYAGDAIRWAVLFQIGWSAAAGLLAARRWPALGAARRKLVAAGLGGFGVLHAAQLARLVAPRRTPPDLVPATLGLLLGLLAYLALRRTRLPLATAAAPPAGRGSPVLLGLERWLVDERGFADHGVTVATAAKHLGVTRAVLSRSVNGGLDRTFSEHLAALRVAEAERLLTDPALGHLSVEALGARAGFRSRSVFFAEFRRRSGESPAEFRRRRVPGAG